VVESTPIPILIRLFRYLEQVVKWFPYRTLQKYNMGRMSLFSLIQQGMRRHLEKFLGNCKIDNINGSALTVESFIIIVGVFKSVCCILLLV